MSNDNTVHRHELHVVFEEDENCVISWRVETDEIVGATSEMSCEEMTEAGAPLAALGIRVLQELLAGQVLELALNKADNYRWRRLFRLSNEAQEVADTPAADETGGNVLRLVH